MPSARARANRHKWEHRSFLLNIRKQFFMCTGCSGTGWSSGTGCPKTLWSIPLWRYPEAARASCSECPCYCKGLDQMASRGSLQHQPIYYSVMESIFYSFKGKGNVFSLQFLSERIDPLGIYLWKVSFNVRSLFKENNLDVQIWRTL